MLPPGPNSPVGVVWIALNKRGIGIHGTDDPNTIGQAVSHGCIRLANWDVVRLAGRVKTGVPVSVHCGVKAEGLLGNHWSNVKFAAQFLPFQAGADRLSCVHSWVSSMSCGVVR